MTLRDTCVQAWFARLQLSQGQKATFICKIHKNHFSLAFASVYKSIFNLKSVVGRATAKNGLDPNDVDRLALYLFNSYCKSPSSSLSFVDVYR